MSDTTNGQMDLLAGPLPADAPLPVTLTDPTCPKCGAALEASRIYRGRDLYRVRSLEVHGDAFEGAADPRGVVVQMDDDAISDECLDVMDEQVQCRWYGGSCDYRLDRDAISDLAWV